MAVTARQGSFAWLLRHELRLTFRASPLGRWSRRGAWPPLLALAAWQGLALLVALGAGMTTRPLLPVPLPTAAALAVGLFVLLLLAQAINAVTEVLDLRGDLDLLLSSPVPPRRVLAVRAAAVAGSVGWPWLLAFGPFANAAAALGHPRFLAVYVVLPGIALVAAAAGFAVTLLLLRVLSVRRTQALAGALATLVGAAVFVLGQAEALLPAAAFRRVSLALRAVPGDGPLSWPARALLGEPLPLLLWAAGCAAVFAAAAAALGAAFESGAALPAVAPARGAVRGDGGPLLGGRFFGGRGALLRKECRLLLRQPGLPTQAVYQLIYLVPAATSLVGGASSAATVLGAAALPVFTAGQLARLLASVTVSGDDVAELAASSPTPAARVRRAKLLAAGLPVAAVLALPMAVVAWRFPLAAPWLLFGCVAATVVELLLGSWYPAKLRRADIGRRPVGSTVATFVGLLIDGLWALATSMAVAATPWAALPAGAALLAVAALYRCRPGRGAGG